MNKRKSEIPAWEWAIAALGACIVLGAIIFFAVQIANPPDNPQFTIHTDSIFVSGSQHVMIIEVRNHGRTVSDVVVEGTLTTGDSQPEQSAVTLSFLPAKSRETAALLFSSDPRSHTFVLKVRSFNEP